ncbi:hypothetical protein M0811_10443 [Anaeramoeba ignava]|uniref:Uncharacterized protein n=1 Tax=Anaeramoeba ignava TaxID=1746090 RepID=A0A9Q0R927_ANAIG|nr:hypothetical protein M0811_10443 [Anaeramoeba ignava]
MSKKQKKTTKDKENSILTQYLNEDVVNFYKKELALETPSKPQEDTLENQEELAETEKYLGIFFKSPAKVEPAILYGLLTVADIFLHYLIVFPVRIGVSIWKKNIKSKINPQLMFDILIGLLMFVVVSHIIFLRFETVLSQISDSQIKLMFMYNSLELLDSLLIKFTVDCLSVLKRTTFDVFSEDPKKTEKKYSKLGIHFGMAYFALFIHTLVLYTSVAMLGLAVTSSKYNMIPFLISNNFVEFKKAVLKKIEENKLRKSYYQDSFERLKLLIFVFCVFVQARTSSDFQVTDSRVSSVKWLFLAEFIVDWSKYAFVFKNNKIEASIFTKFRNGLSKFVLRSQEIDDTKIYQNHVDSIEKEMKITTIPLVCLYLSFLLEGLFRSVSFVAVFILGIFIFVFGCVLTYSVRILLLYLSNKFSQDQEKEDEKENEKEKVD